MKEYLLRVLIGFDQFGNTLIGGMPDETISSRIARNKNKWYWRPLYKALNFISPMHCEQSEEVERQRLQYPPELR